MDGVFQHGIPAVNAGKNPVLYTQKFLHQYGLMILSSCAFDWARERKYML